VKQIADSPHNTVAAGFFRPRKGETPMNQLTTVSFEETLESIILPKPTGCRTCGLMGHDLEAL